MNQVDLERLLDEAEAIRWETLRYKQADFTWVIYDALDRYRKTGLRPNYPMSVGVKLTSKCNMKCFYCSNAKTAGTPLPAARRLQVLDELSEAGCIVHLTGGEPLLDTALFPTIDLLAAKRVPLTLFTNGLLINNSIAEELSRRACNTAFSVQVSLDGGEAFYASRFSNRGYLRSISSAIDCLKKANIHVRLNMVVNRHNLDEMTIVFAVAHAHGVDEVALTPIFVTPETRDLFPGNGEIVTAYHQAMTVFQRKGYRFAVIQSPEACRYGLRAHSDFDYKCPAGISSCEIDEYGNVYPCAFLNVPRFQYGNVAEMDLGTVWSDPRWREWFVREKPSGTCTSKCDGVCPASSSFAFGNLDGCDIRCELVGNRAAV